MNKDKKIALLLIAMLMVWTLVLVSYFNYSLRIAREDYDAKITTLGQLTADALKSVQQDISNLSSQADIMDSSLKSFKKENEQGYLLYRGTSMTSVSKMKVMNYREYLGQR